MKFRCLINICHTICSETCIILRRDGEREREKDLSRWEIKRMLLFLWKAYCSFLLEQLLLRAFNRSRSDYRLRACKHSSRLCIHICRSNSSAMTWPRTTWRIACFIPMLRKVIIIDVSTKIDRWTMMMMIINLLACFQLQEWEQSKSFSIKASP